MSTLPSSSSVPTQEEIGVHWLSNSNVNKLVKSRPVEVCDGCGKQDRVDGARIMKCVGCISVGYCSKECQATDWKEHKAFCKTSKIVDAVQPLIVKFYEDRRLLYHLRLALMLRSRMFLDPDSSYCLVTQVKLGFHCSNTEDNVKLYTGPYSDFDESAEMPGFLEIREIGITRKVDTSHAISEYSESSQIIVRLWKQARKKADSLGRRGPIMIVDFEYEHQEITIAVEIPPELLFTAYGKPVPESLRLKLPERSATTNEKYDWATPANLIGQKWKGQTNFSLNVERYADKAQKVDTEPLARNVVNMIRRYIEVDTENRLGLRGVLRESDKEFVRAMGRYMKRRGD